MMRMMMIFSMIESSAMMLCGLNDGDDNTEYDDDDADDEDDEEDENDENDDDF